MRYKKQNHAGRGKRRVVSRHKPRMTIYAKYSLNGSPRQQFRLCHARVQRAKHRKLARFRARIVGSEQ
jgi:hypothetical protein